MRGTDRPLLEMRDVRLGYRGQAVLENVLLDVRRGDLLALVGPNGAGKTTLLRALIGILKPMSGEIVTHGEKPPRVGYVPQRENLDPLWPLRVFDVVLMGRYALRGALRRIRREDHEAALRALELCGIRQLSERPVAELSGGQIQRVLIARALAADPELLVLDEPTGGLDLRGTASMLELVTSLHRDQDLTILVVSHDLNTVATVATRVALVHAGRVREGAVDEILSPAVLTEVYGFPVYCGEIQGRRVVWGSPER